MRSCRRRSIPPVPRSLSELGDILITQEFGNSFSCHGTRICKGIIRTGDDAATSLVFYCEEAVNRVAGQVTEIHADATFKTVPAAPSARQFFTIHVIFENHVSDAVN